MMMARANCAAVCGTTVCERGAVAHMQMPVVGAGQGQVWWRGCGVGMACMAEDWFEVGSGRRLEAQRSR